MASGDVSYCQRHDWLFSVRTHSFRSNQLLSKRVQNKLPTQLDFKILHRTVVKPWFLSCTRWPRVNSKIIHSKSTWAWRIITYAIQSWLFKEYQWWTSRKDIRYCKLDNVCLLENHHYFCEAYERWVLLGCLWWSEQKCQQSFLMLLLVLKGPSQQALKGSSIVYQEGW